MIRWVKEKDINLLKLQFRKENASNNLASKWVTLSFFYGQLFVIIIPLIFIKDSPLLQLVLDHLFRLFQILFLINFDLLCWLILFLFKHNLAFLKRLLLVLFHLKQYLLRDYSAQPLVLVAKILQEGAQLKCIRADCVLVIYGDQL